MATELESRRGKISAIDDRLAGLLAERFSVVRSLAGLKKKVRDPGRETAVLKRAALRVKDRNLRAAVTAVYREIIRQSRCLQQKI